MILTRYKKDLVGQLGNLLNRTTAKSLIRDGIIPVKSNLNMDARDESIHAKLTETAGKCTQK